MSLIEIYTDGSSRGNPGPGGYGIVMSYKGSEKEISQGAKDISRFYCYFGAWFKNERPVEQGLIERLTDEEMSKLEMYSPENMRKNSIIGTPEEVINRIKLCEELGYDEYSYWIDSSMDFETKKKSLQLFIDKVMPAFN